MTRSRWNDHRDVYLAALLGLGLCALTACFGRLIDNPAAQLVAEAIRDEPSEANAIVHLAIGFASGVGSDAPAAPASSQREYSVEFAWRTKAEWTLNVFSADTGAKLMSLGSAQSSALSKNDSGTRLVKGKWHMAPDPEPSTLDVLKREDLRRIPEVVFKHVFPLGTTWSDIESYARVTGMIWSKRGRLVASSGEEEYVVRLQLEADSPVPLWREEDLTREDVTLRRTDMLLGVREWRLGDGHDWVERRTYARPVLLSGDSILNESMLIETRAWGPAVTTVRSTVVSAKCPDSNDTKLNHHSLSRASS